MATKTKAIITCAVTGGAYTPTMSPHLPVTPAAIAAEAIAAAEAGAALLHLHARDPQDGRPSIDPELFMRFLPAIADRTDAVIVINTGGAQGAGIEQRLGPAMRARPEMCSFNLGAMCLGLFPMAEGFRDWKHGWEVEHLERSRGLPTGNTFQDVERILRDLGEGHGTRFEFECYDIGHLYNLAHFLERGLVRPPLFIQSAFGFLGGIGAETENLLHMKRTADGLFGDDHVWSVMSARDQIRVGVFAAIAGGSVRVGLEDSLTVDGRLATGNAEQVAKIGRIFAELGIEVASAAEAREILKLKGRSDVAF